MLTVFAAADTARGGFASPGHARHTGPGIPTYRSAQCLKPSSWLFVLGPWSWVVSVIVADSPVMTGLGVELVGPLVRSAPIVG